MKQFCKILLCLLLASVIASCAKRPTNPEDPFEKFNRVMFALNMDVDRLIMRPIATVYHAITPPPAQRGITNFFDNIQVITTFPNDILQGKFRYALIDVARFLVNSTIGIGGLFDVASHAGLPKHYEDFGMTLAYYSDNKSSPFLVAPLIGPTTLRAGIGFPVDALASPWYYLKPDSLKYGLFALRIVNLRAILLPSNKLIDTAFDPYAFLRDAYMQRRRQLIANNEHDYSPAKAAKREQARLEEVPIVRHDITSQSANPNIQPEEKKAVVKSIHKEMVNEGLATPKSNSNGQPKKAIKTEQKSAF